MHRVARTLALAAVVTVVVIAPLHAAPDTAVHPCGHWVLYKQCGESWSGNELGTSSNTICSAGCAMSSVAMSLATDGERVHGSHTTPGSLNAWLKTHKGYVGGDELVWNAVAPLGKLHLKTFTQTMSTDDIRKAVNHCHPVIANVRDRTHWVLITGYDTSDSEKFYVNDPGFPDAWYGHSGMSWFTVYTNSSSDAMSAEEATAAVQAAPEWVRKSPNIDDAVKVPPAGAAGAGVSPGDSDVEDPYDGVYGIDVSTPISTSEVGCMKNQHAVTLVCSRCYTEDGTVDSAALATYKAARDNKVPQFDVYHFPCQKQSAKSQIDTSVAHLRDNGVNFTTFWLDIENSDWGSDHARNIQFIGELGSAARAHGLDVGIYTSEWSWTPITGDDHTLSEHYRLWWPNYGNPPDKSFSDFKPFGGWNHPFQKQYKGNYGLCGANVDVSWRP